MARNTAHPDEMTASGRPESAQTVEEATQLLEREGTRITRRGSQLGWTSLEALLSEQGEIEFEVNAEAHFFELCLEGQVVGENRFDACATAAEAIYRPGNCFFVPRQQHIKVLAESGSGTNFQLFIEPRLMTEAKRAVLGGDADRVDLYGFNSLQAPRMRQIASAIHRELVSPSAGGALVADAMALALCVEIVRGYADGRVKAYQERPALTEERLGRVLDYLEEHLGENIGLSELAGAAGLSDYHFSRSFKAATGESPHQYLIRRRTERACEYLAEGSLSLADIAYALGFSSQAHFSNTFKARQGVTPGAYRKAVRK